MKKNGFCLISYENIVSCYCHQSDMTGIHIPFFLFLHENVCFGYSLEVPDEVLLKSTHNMHFHGEIRKILVLFS